MSDNVNSDPLKSVSYYWTSGNYGVAKQSLSFSVVLVTACAVADLTGIMC